MLNFRNKYVETIYLSLGTYQECPNTLIMNPYCCNATLLAKWPKFDGTIWATRQTLCPITVQYQCLNIVCMACNLERNDTNPSSDNLRPTLLKITLQLYDTCYIKSENEGIYTFKFHEFSTWPWVPHPQNLLCASTYNCCTRRIHCQAVDRILISIEGWRWKW